MNLKEATIILNYVKFKGINPVRLLKQETGKTALELIHLYVISEAKNLLLSGERSISEIAYRLGFENPPYFSRLFKKEVGISPTEFKSQLLN